MNPSTAPRIDPLVESPASTGSLRSAQPGYPAKTVTDEGVLESLRSLEPGGMLRFRLSQVPVDELLLTVHASRFTGSVGIGDYPADQIFLREGAVVGVAPKQHLHAQLLGQVLIQQKAIDRETLERVLAEEKVDDGMLLGQRLLHMQLIDAEDLDRACAEQGRRRLFYLYEYDDADVLVSQGIARLSHFHPSHVDVRPAIAYGMVVRSGAARRRAIVDRVRGRWVKLRSPYDEQRNSYGLPPPVLQGIRCLHEGEVAFGEEPRLPGLGPDETAGVLLLFERMSLLEIVR
jgi:hypothetical protein